MLGFEEEEPMNRLRGFLAVDLGASVGLISSDIDVDALRLNVQSGRR